MVQEDHAGWVYEVADDADYNAGSPDHDKPFYFLEVRIQINRLDVLAKQGLIRDFIRVVLEAEGPTIDRIMRGVSG